MGNGKRNFEAAFKENNIEASVLMDASGKVLQTEKEIAVSMLPQAIRDYAAKTLSGKKIKEASKITDAAGMITYEAEIEETDYLFDEKGNFLQTQPTDAQDSKDKD